MATASSSGLSSALAGGADTIAARASAEGRGALAVIRVSGPDARGVARAVCPDLDFERGWRSSLISIFSSRHEVLDTGVVTPFPGDRSYTGEDLFEMIVHGSPFLVGAILSACESAGARPAAPGEFTRRAVANGKLDLVQAEAIADLVRAETAWQHRNAREQLSGMLSRRFVELREGLVTLLALVEASLEFEAQAVEVPEAELREQAADVMSTVGELMASAGAGERIREGLRAVILGPPNAGKSTLFNTLCGRDRAIVSPRPGTTRDVVDAEIDLGGLAVVVHDTAGLRVGGDAVEEEGHRRALGVAATADFVILLWPADDDEAPSAPEGVPVIQVRSKADLGCPARQGWLSVSCHSGRGLEKLSQRLVEVAQREVADLGGAVAIAARHRRALEKVRSAVEGCDWSVPEVAAERVREAVGSAEELLGAVSDEAVLDQVFSTFCIGK